MGGLFSEPEPEPAPRPQVKEANNESSWTPQVKEANNKPSQPEPEPTPQAKEESTDTDLKNGVDHKKPNISSFFLYAKDLSITWVEEKRYWRWSKIEETRSDTASDTAVDVAELVEVCWLEVRGKFETTKLSAGATYEVAFVVMMKQAAYGWEVPVNVRLILPDGNKQERKEDLKKKPRGEWIEIPVGEFVASTEKAGEMEFSIYEHVGGKWKSGLVIKGIAIRPKN